MLRLLPAPTATFALAMFMCACTFGLTSLSRAPSKSDFEEPRLDEEPDSSKESSSSSSDVFDSFAIAVRFVEPCDTRAADRPGRLLFPSEAVA